MLRFFYNSKNVQDDVFSLPFFRHDVFMMALSKFDYSHTNTDGFGDHLRDVAWQRIFKLGVSAADDEFCDNKTTAAFTYKTKVFHFPET